MTSLPNTAAAPARGSRRSRASCRGLSALSLAVSLGCGAMVIASGAARAQERGASTGFEGDLMSEIMLAELASRRGLLDVATGKYLRAAARSEDPRVADHATRLATFAHRWPEAERAARRWMELDAEALESSELLAQSLLQQGDTGSAASEYVALVGRVPPARSAKTADPAGDAAMPAATGRPTRDAVLRGVQTTLQGLDPTPAGIVMSALVEAFPDEVEAHLGVARLALAASDRERALGAVDTALEIDAGDRDALLIRARILVAEGRADVAFDELGALLESAPEDVRLRLGYAQLLTESGRDEAAQAEFETLYGLARNEADVLLTIGLLSFDAGHMKPARRYLEALLENGGYAAEAHFYLARIADRARSTETAIAHYEAVEPGQLYADARLRAAELYALAGDVETGRARLRALADELPDPAVQTQLIIVDARLLQEGGAAEKAIAVLGDGLERFPDDPDLLYARALAALSTGQPELFESDLERLIEIEPENAQALNALGYHLTDVGLRLDEAARYLEKANELEPDDAAILDSLGWLRYRQGKLGTAVTLLRRAHALYPDVEIAAHLGEVLWMQGEHEAAREIWQEALSEQPDNDTLQRTMQKLAN